MEPVLTDVEIVLVAEEHDLDLVEWLNRSSALEGKSSNIFQYEGHSSVDTSKFSINKLEQELTISPKKFEQDNLIEAQTIVRQYIKEFPNFSYTAIAFNFVWVISSVDADQLKNTFVADRERFDRIFSGSSYSMGGLLAYLDKTFIVRVIIPPQVSSPVYVTFAYRSESEDVGELSERLSYFTKAIDNTRDMIVELLGD